jgi:hypothetical protein
MTNILYKQILSFLILSVLMVSCQFNEDNSELKEQVLPGEKEASIKQQELEIVEFVEKLLFAAGNKNVEAMKEMIIEDALVGNTSIKDSLWMTNQWTVDEIYEIYQSDQSEPYLEIVDDYDIIVTDRIALVKADATINRFGIPGKREINHMILIKSDDQWKLFSIAWSVHQQPEDKLKFDMDIFAKGYAQVWGSQRPEFVAMFYEEDGALQVNEGEPAMGRKAISDLAQSFMTQFPDMNVSFDSLVQKTKGVEFHWTLTGTDADPNGKGHKVRVSGFEFWTMSEGNLIKDSKGHFSSDEYKRQLEFGITTK